MFVFNMLKFIQCTLPVHVILLVNMEGLDYTVGRYTVGLECIELSALGFSIWYLLSKSMNFKRPTSFLVHKSQNSNTRSLFVFVSFVDLNLKSPIAELSISMCMYIKHFSMVLAFSMETCPVILSKHLIHQAL